MKLIHHSREPFEFDPEHVYGHHDIARAVGKPRGLWLSDEDTDWGWRAWCESEEFNLGGLAYETEFTLAPGANVLVLSTLLDLVAFTGEYGAPLMPDAPTSISKVIDWNRVAAAYDGIIITPYVGEARWNFDLFWYYGWDVASGCIWNLKALVPGATALTDVRIEAP